MKFPFDELNLRDAEHVEWVKSQRDAELWHVAAIAMLNFLGDPHGLLVWLMDQPETDRATAGYVFLGGMGADYLRGETDFLGEGLSSEQWRSAMEAICRRASTTGFTNDSLGLHPGFRTAQQECLALVQSGQVADGLEVPKAILDAPFPAERQLPYFIEDGAVLDSDPSPIPVKR